MKPPPPSGSPPAAAGSLAVLRATIDAVDHEVLALLGRRNALVGEIAAYKRAHTVRIRDLHREQEIFTDRRQRAASVGLSPDVIESMYRLILWASRDRQAALRVEVPPDVEPRTVAVIGGHGAMGKCMAKLFADLGHAVMLSPEEAASVADVVLISVPIDVTVDVIRRLGPRVRNDALLMDVTSIKTGPVEAMLAACQAEVVGTHPLFGPSVHSLQGQRIVVTPARGARCSGPGA
ncbi:MAG: prephenate dehydrogenase/arogenate dehydrogenase family protein [Planctomycetota bacterium]|jgi:chorismate mutase/prephenate dehydrogenase